MGHAGVLPIVGGGVPMYPPHVLGLRGPSSTRGELGVVSRLSSIVNLHDIGVFGSMVSAMKVRKGAGQSVPSPGPRLCTWWWS